MKLVKRNYKVIVGIIIGIVLTGSITYAASVSSKDVTYSNTSSGLTSTNIQGAIDELNTKASTLTSNLSTYQNYIKMNSEKNVFLVGTSTSKAICIDKNDQTHCFETNIGTIEVDHLKNVFSDINCDNGNSSGLLCQDSDFICWAGYDGMFSCTDVHSHSYCQGGGGYDTFCN